MRKEKIIWAMGFTAVLASVILPGCAPDELQGTRTFLEATKTFAEMQQEVNRHKVLDIRRRLRNIVEMRKDAATRQATSVYLIALHAEETLREECLSLGGDCSDIF